MNEKSNKLSLISFIISIICLFLSAYIFFSKFENYNQFQERNFVSHSKDEKLEIHLINKIENETLILKDSVELSSSYFSLISSGLNDEQNNEYQKNQPIKLDYTKIEIIIPTESLDKDKVNSYINEPF